MSFFRRRSRGLALRPVNRIKHVIDTQLSQVAGTATAATLAESKDSPVLANVQEVLTGSTIRGIFLVVEAYATSSAALSNFYLMIFKNPGGNLTFPNPNVIGSNDNKKYVIHQEMVMFQKVTPSNPRTIFKGVIVIPRHLQRMAPGDFLSLKVFSPGINSDVCFQCHYKEFR